MTLRDIARAIVSDRVRAGAIVTGGILIIALLDFSSGTEIRVFPLYYGPIALAAWVFGRNLALVSAAAGALGWLLANRLAGQEYSHPAIWVLNTLVQGTSFAIIGLLVSYLRDTVVRERAVWRIDPLSGLMNRRAFYEEGERLLGLCRRGRRPVTLAYFDLDNFKTVNDTLGHMAGDALLRAIGQTMQFTMRSSDLTARLGGDEFAALMPELGPDEAGQALRRLRESINEVAHSTSATVSVTIGAVTLMTPPADVETMVGLADTVMYAAKREGKDRIRLETIEAAHA